MSDDGLAGDGHADGGQMRIQQQRSDMTQDGTEAHDGGREAVSGGGGDTGSDGDVRNAPQPDEGNDDFDDDGIIVDMADEPIVDGDGPVSLPQARRVSKKPRPARLPTDVKAATFWIRRSHRYETYKLWRAPKPRQVSRVIAW